MLKQPQKIKIYTDGACSGNHKKGLNPGGWGVLFIYGDHEQTMSGGEKNTTNNRMELMAVIQALEYLQHSVEIELYTDSQYVQKGISEWIHNWKRRNWRTAVGKPVKNQDLWIRLDNAVKKQSNIKWDWVKGHSGNRENDIVDKLAVNAIP
ncbi:MAG: ribonuclease HI [Proteobacteria bacterium]|nr:ribonuclease HI [Pseudomonadota bacterium]